MWLYEERNGNRRLLITMIQYTNLYYEQNYTYNGDPGLYVLVAKSTYAFLPLNNSVAAPMRMDGLFCLHSHCTSMTFSSSMIAWTTATTTNGHSPVSTLLLDRPSPLPIDEFMVDNQTLWSYDSKPQISDDWKTKQYDDSQWSRYQTSSLPSSLAVTKYYRAAVSYKINTRLFPSLFIGVRCREGIVIYINEKQFYTHSMPNNTAITSETLALQEDPDYTYHTIVYSSFLLSDGTGTLQIAIEVHPSANHVVTPDLFEFFILPIYRSTVSLNFGATIDTINYYPWDVPPEQGPKELHRRLEDYAPPPTSGSHNGSDVSLAFDFNHLTNWNCYSSTICNCIIQFPANTFLWINEVHIVASSPYPTSFPTTVHIYGSNDSGQTATILLRTSVPSVAAGATHVMHLRNHHEYYNAYVFSFQVSSTSTPFLSISEIKLFTSPDITSEQLSYRSSFYSVSLKTDFFELPITSVPMEFTCKWNTPHSSITFDQQTGLIHGTFYESEVLTLNITGTCIVDTCQVNYFMIINAYECLGPTYVNIYIDKISTHPSGLYEWVTLYDSTKQKVITTIEPSLTARTSVPICLKEDLYYLQLNVLFPAIRWKEEEYVEVTFFSRYDSFTLLKTTYDDLYQSSSSFFIPISLKFLVYYYSNQVYRYSKSASSISPQWYSALYVQDDDWWNDLISPYIFPTSYYCNHYYRLQFELPSAPFDVMEIRLNSSPQTICYLNDNAFYSTISSSVESVSYVFKTISVGNIYFVNGTNTLSCAEVFSSSTPVPMRVEFVLSMRPKNNTLAHSRSPFMNPVNSFPYSDQLNNVSKIELTDQYSNDSENFVEFLFAFTDLYQYESINMYCFSFKEHFVMDDPHSWTLYGCSSPLNDNECKLLSVHEDVDWPRYSVQRCFTIPLAQSTQLFHRFKLTFYQFSSLSVEQTGVTVAYVDFYYQRYQVPSHILFYYTPVHLIAYFDTDIEPAVPNTRFVLYKVVGNPLPHGLYLDSSTGYIYGHTYNYLYYYKVTIRAYDALLSSYDTSFYITVMPCNKGRVLLSYVYISLDSIHYSKYELSMYNSHSELIHTSQFSSKHHYSASICLLEGNYSITIDKDMFTPWVNSRFDLVFYDQLIHIELNELDTPALNTAVELKSELTCEDIVYYYNFNTTLYPLTEDWFLPQKGHLNWTRNILGVIPHTESITRYYVTEDFWEPDVEYVYLSLNVTYDVGLIVYINGVEIFRDNLPSGPVTSSTYALSAPSRKNYEYYTYILYSAVPLYQAMNCFAFEVHNSRDPLPYDTFSFSFTKVHEGTYVYQGGKIYAIFPQKMHDLENAIDGNLNTTIKGDRCIGSSFIYQFGGNKKKIATSLTLTSASTCNHWTPSGWRIEGSNDYGTTWIPLFEINNVTFTRYQQSYTYSFLPTIAYNKYLFVVTECNNVNLEPYSEECEEDRFHLAEVALYVRNIGNTCPAEGSWPAAIYGTYSIQPCGQFMLGTRRRLCNNGVLEEEVLSDCQISPPTQFHYNEDVYYIYVDQLIAPMVPYVNALNLTFSVSPPLPCGLLLDELTGVISGTPLESTEQVKFNITASNPVGQCTTVLTIVVIGDHSQFYCLPSGSLPLTKVNQVVTTPCPPGYQGTIATQCTYKNAPVWVELDNNCVFDPTYVSIHYDHDSYDMELNSPLSINCTYTGLIYSWDIQPPTLPQGLTVENCTISGTPVEIFGATQFTIQAIGDNVHEVVLTLSVSKHFCEEKEDLPRGEVNAMAQQGCYTQYYSGYRLYTCSYSFDQGAQWTLVEDHCTMMPPVIRYPQSNYTIYVNDEIERIAPEVEGIVNFFSISPSLPEYLEFDSTNGTITGMAVKPLEINTYVVTAHNRDNDTSVNLYLYSIEEYCEKEGEWERTLRGAKYSRGCNDPNKQGNRVRECLKTSPATWGPVINYCTYIKPVIEYPFTTKTLYRNVEIEPLVPSSLYYIQSWTIKPDLPLGLTLSEKTGVISGTSLEVSTKLQYTVTAQNEDQKTSVSFLMSVNQLYCEKEGEWETTEVNARKWLSCDNTLLAFKSRYCSYYYRNGVPVGTWEEANRNGCDNYPRRFDKPLRGHTIVWISFSYFGINANMLNYTVLDGYIHAFADRYESLGLTESDVFLISADSSNQDVYNYTFYFSLYKPSVEPFLGDISEFISTSISSYLGVYNIKTTQSNYMPESISNVSYTYIGHEYVYYILLAIIFLMLITLCVTYYKIRVLHANPGYHAKKILNQALLKP